MLAYYLILKQKEVIHVKMVAIVIYILMELGATIALGLNESEGR
jgi:hypothetical protein